MSAETWAWIAVVLITNTITAVVIIDTYRRRVFEIRRRHARDNERAQQAVAAVKIKSRLLDAVPVSRLIEQKEEQ